MLVEDEDEAESVAPIGVTARRQVRRMLDQGVLQARQHQLDIEQD